MTAAGYVLRNALRNKRRLILTISSLAVSLFLYTTLQTALREMTTPAESADSALRLITRHRVSLANVLPERYVYRIRQIPGVEEVTKFTWFGGIYQDERNFFPQFAVEADKIFRIFTEAKVDPAQLDAFIRERNAAVVGIKTMERFGWKLGDRITLRGTIWDCNPELVIRAVYSGGIDETNLMFHHDYLDELMGRLGLVGTFWIKVRRPEDVQSVIEAIDASFRNTEAETRTETERAFQLGFISMFGNIRLLIGSISTVIVFTILLVSASTMSMAIRERMRELAILKTLGFNARQLFGFILAESFGLAMAGGLLGSLGAWALYSNIDVYKWSRGVFLKFEVTPQILASALIIAGAIGVLSCLVPARAAVRAPVLAGLKEID